MLSLHA
jgi:hypothetical protein